MESAPSVSGSSSEVDQKKRKPEQPAPSDDADSWTKVDRRRGKKKRKLEAKMSQSPPAFMYVKSEIQRRKEAVSIADVRDLVLHAVADAPPAGWIRVENPTNIRKTVVLLIPGITKPLLGITQNTSATTNPNLPLTIPLPSATTSSEGSSENLSDDEAAGRGGIPFIARTFSHTCPTRAPGDATRMHSVLSDFFHAPVSAEEKRRRIRSRVASEREMKKTVTQYVLTVQQMIDNNYPTPAYLSDVFSKPSGWVETPRNDEPADSNEPSVYAIDCEMCITEDGKELTRVCIVDYNSRKVVFDQLVKPSKPIVDYLTRFSGITEEALADVSTTLRDVQNQLLTLLSAKPTLILLGHSLESDLNALKLCHPSCIDTAVIYHHPRGRPLKPGLAWLTRKWCGREIQTRGEGGHDPEEDARACIDLLHKKIENGPSFGEFKTDVESIFQRISRSSDARLSAVVDHGNPSNWHGAQATTTVACSTDEEVFQGVIESIPRHTLVFGRLTELASALGWITPRPNAESPSVPLPTPPSVPDALTALERRLSAIYDALPPCTAFIIMSGHSDPRNMSALSARRVAFENSLRSLAIASRGRTSATTPADKSKEVSESSEPAASWTTRDARELEEEVAKARQGLLFVGVKV